MSKRVSFFDSVFKEPSLSGPIGKAAFDDYEDINFLKDDKSNSKHSVVVNTVKEEPENPYIFTEKDIIKREKRMTSKDFGVNFSKTPADAKPASEFPNGNYSTIPADKNKDNWKLKGNFSNIPSNKCVLTKNTIDTDQFNLSAFEEAVKLDDERRKKDAEKEVLNKPSFEEYISQPKENMVSEEYGNPVYEEDILDQIDDKFKDESMNFIKNKFFKPKPTEESVEEVVESSVAEVEMAVEDTKLSTEVDSALDDDVVHMEVSEEEQEIEETNALEDEPVQITETPEKKTLVNYSPVIEVPELVEEIVEPEVVKTVEVEETSQEEKNIPVVEEEVNEVLENVAKPEEGMNFVDLDIAQTATNNNISINDDDFKMKSEHKKAWKDFTNKIMELIG